MAKKFGGLQSYINKQVPFKYHGVDLAFNLSMGLFSSFDIDMGTKLLMKTLAQQVDFSSMKSVIDIGCGVGTIGVSLKKKYPHLEVVLRDRDALAVAFSQMNSAINKVETTTMGGLMLRGLEEAQYDCIISNIPAKAGGPIIEDFIRNAGHSLSENGVCAVVIVRTLSKFVKECIGECGFDLIHEDHSKQHSVYHFRGAPAERTDDFSLYIRHKGNFRLKRTSYPLETVYNIPDFDQTGFAVDLAADILGNRVFKGKSLFWNPGQGHIPVFFLKKQRGEADSLYLASRDALELEISEKNVTAMLDSLKSDCIVNSFFTPSIKELVGDFEPESLDFISIAFRKVPGAGEEAELAEVMGTLLKKGGFACITGKSADLHFLLKAVKGCATVVSKKFKGQRGVLLKLL